MDTLSWQTMNNIDVKDLLRSIQNQYEKLLLEKQELQLKLTALKKENTELKKQINVS